MEKLKEFRASYINENNYKNPHTNTSTEIIHCDKQQNEKRRKALNKFYYVI